MTWQDRARQAALDNAANGRTAAERELVAAVTRLQLQDEVGTEPEVEVSDGWLRLGLPDDGESLQVELRARLNGARGCRLFVPSGTSAEWVDAGAVHTDQRTAVIMLGRLLTDGPPAASPEQTTGDLLLQVVTGLVQQVVHDVIDGRLGDGPP